MNTTLKVLGMHCEACKSLIKMELEENGYESNIESISLVSDNKGEITLINISEQEFESIRQIINSMKSYQVV